MNEALQASELLRGVYLGFGLAIVFIALGGRGLMGIAMANTNYPSGQKSAWALIIPFILLGLYLIGLALFAG